MEKLAMEHHRGNISFFGTYRPPAPLDLFSLPINPLPSSDNDELLLTDDVSYNQNGKPIPAAALKELLTFLAKKKPGLAPQYGATREDVTGLVFVSERDGGLETLHVALRSLTGGEVKVLSLGDIYGAKIFSGVRMEDSGCIAGDATVGHSLVYVSTKEPVESVVYKIELATGKTVRLTPLPQYDLSPPPSYANDELLLTDDENSKPIPAAALKELLTSLAKNNRALAPERGATPEDVDKAGGVTGRVFVSERCGGLETLHVALTTAGDAGEAEAKVKVLSLGDFYGGVPMEDSGFTMVGDGGTSTTVGHSLVYVSTKKLAKARRTPWTAVYKTALATGETVRLTPPSEYDLSPAVSPSGKLVAVANFAENKWDGEIEKLKTNIVVMDVDGQGRKVLIEDAGWPSWGSEDVIFFHRGFDQTPATKSADWAVFRYDIAAGKEERVTPEGIDAMTPAAISETKVAVATVRKKSRQQDMHVERVTEQYRHIEIFDTAATTLGQENSVQISITQKTRRHEDHYNPFVLDGGARIGYHRCRSDKLRMIGGAAGSEKSTTIICIDKKFDEVQPPAALSDAGLYRVTGVFPSVSKNGKKLAFVDNEFKAVWLAVADETRPRVIYRSQSGKSVFSTSWNQNDALDTLYVCEGPAFSIDQPVQILRIPKVCSRKEDHEILQAFPLTAETYNCAFPSSNAEGTKLVFRGSRDRVGGDKHRSYKNLFVIDAVNGELTADGALRPDAALPLTNGAWTDTHCSWSPREGCDWVVFSSTMDKPTVGGGVPEKDHGLDPGYFAVYLVSAKDLKKGEVPSPVRVIHSAPAPNIAGHVNHPVFSPDMRSIVFTADLAAVSADPISLPHFTHSVRPYGDIFVVDLQSTEDMKANKDIQDFHRVTHSRYEYATPTWSCRFVDPNGIWKMPELNASMPGCPIAHGQSNATGRAGISPDTSN
ncbi:hypothetical protein U9M48_000825 [Paspalum notatum var. saurae]|uniref:Uncharacterized protein n=1 Tax=Paspalum notatum var. saurae TaxID=547442 RepID=A0AAQ3PHG7_PASNO